MNLNEKMTLKATVKTRKKVAKNDLKVTVKSSKPTVAKISGIKNPTKKSKSGMTSFTVTGKKAGSAKITVTAKNKSTKGKKLKKTITVNVNSSSSSDLAPDTKNWTDKDKIYVYVHTSDMEEMCKEAIKRMGTAGKYVEIYYVSDYYYAEEYKSALNGKAKKYPSVLLTDVAYVDELMSLSNTAKLDGLGIKPAMYGNNYEYTIKQGKYKGSQKALPIIASPGVFFYRADIAKAVLGTDDPARVGEAISTWDKYIDVAKKMSAKGYYMNASYNDILTPLLHTGSSSSCINNSTAKLPDSVTSYFKMQEILYNNNCINSGENWDAIWSGQMGCGNTFGYFGAPWFVSTVSYNCPNYAENYGQWRVTTGPSNYNWGGTYVMAGAKSSNPKLTAYFISKLCCDETTLYNITKNAGGCTFTANKNVNQRLIKEGYGSQPVLGGQKPFAIYDKVASNIKDAYCCKLEYGLNGIIPKYNYSSIDECLEAIKRDMKDYYNITVQ